MEEQAMAKFMELMNWPAFIVATLVPMIVGSIWYNPKTPMGATWLKETGLSNEKMKGANMPLIFGLSFLFAFIMNFFIVSHEVVHQYGAGSLLLKHPEEMLNVLTKYSNEFRTFPHGMLHGAFLGLFFVFPLFATNGMFERKSWKLIIVNSAYWTVSLMIMGGIICVWQ